jgi:hypothetical protein
MKDAIEKSLRSGKVGRACHPIQDYEAVGHRGQQYPGGTPEHVWYDLSPLETPAAYSKTLEFLRETAPPSIWQRAFGR